MNPWMTPWWALMQLPFSGDVTQDNSPLTNWWSPQIEFNFAGKRRVEADIVANAVSYGAQLGVLTDVLVELTKEMDSAAIKRLREVADKIEVVKDKHSTDTVTSLKVQLRQLKKENATAYAALMAELGEAAGAQPS